MRSIVSSTRVGFVGVKPKSDDFKILAGWLESGLIIPLDATVSIHDVPQALARLKRGEVLGKVAVDVTF
jgi:hypothetical protein